MQSPRGAGRTLLRSLLASSSVVALLIGGGTPPAYAACSTSITGTTAGCTNTGSLSGITINNATVTSGIYNTAAGTISPNGIIVTNSTINGSIVDSGTLAGGIYGRQREYDHRFHRTQRRCRGHWPDTSPAASVMPAIFCLPAAARQPR